MKSARMFALLAIIACAKVTTFPPADFAPGWAYQFAPEKYSPDNLHEIIDGEAELYRQYDVVEMTAVSWVHQDDASQTVSVELYDMGNALNAFGIYSHYRRPDMPFADIGQGAVVSELSARFWQGRYFVRLNAGSLSPFVQDAMRALADSMAAALPPAPAPQELSFLPLQDQSPNTLRYIATPYQGIAALPRTLEAHYQSATAEWTGFIVLFPSPADAAQAMNVSNAGEGMLLRQESRYILGVRDYTAAEEAVEFLQRLGARCAMW
ncbi:hypothetical protein JW998_05190 [candidate division KSB1 bacterium]|nr:hypothetical protein [candidate division KSB1 bacterium]